MGRKPLILRKASFFKVLLGDFTHKLRIPPAFVKNFHGKLINEAILERRTGGVWSVKVEIDSGKFFFQNGWQGFVEDNSLEAGDFLVFRYDGKSSFGVDIFDRSGCEKVKGYFQEVQRKERVLRKGGKHFVHGAAVCQCRYIQINDIKKSLASSKNISLHGVGGKNKKVAVDIETKMVFESVSCPFKLKHPHFTARWRSRKPYSLPIPSVFGREYGLNKTQFRFLCDASGKLWPVKINYSHNRSDFGTGLHDFRVANNVKDGDKFIFEFVEPSVIRVHIIGAIK